MFSELLNDIRQTVVERMFVSLPRISMMTAVPKVEAPAPAENAKPSETANNKGADKAAGKKKKK